MQPAAIQVSYAEESNCHLNLRSLLTRMFVVRRNAARLYPAGLQLAKMSSQLGDLGSGAGKGGGGGGSIREAGGAFGKMEAAREEEYFYKKVSVV
ncbi:hypothetical protein ACLKA7_014188 [Drosophila subpalustris]